MLGSGEICTVEDSDPIRGLVPVGNPGFLDPWYVKVQVNGINGVISLDTFLEAFEKCE